MIISFKDRETELVWDGYVSKKLPRDIQDRARRKLGYIDVATCVDDLKALPGNNLEMLQGNLQNYYSIRINRQWRIIFMWRDGDAYEVQIIDYH